MPLYFCKCITQSGDVYGICHFCTDKKHITIFWIESLYFQFQPVQIDPSSNSRSRFNFLFSLLERIQSGPVFLRLCRIFPPFFFILLLSHDQNRSSCMYSQPVEITHLSSFWLCKPILLFHSSHLTRNHLDGRSQFFLPLLNQLICNPIQIFPLVAVTIPERLIVDFFLDAFDFLEVLLPFMLNSFLRLFFPVLCQICSFFSHKAIKFSRRHKISIIVKSSTCSTRRLGPS